MKKIMLGLVILLTFQVCTSELSEIDGVLGDHIESDLIETNTDEEQIEIPTDSFLGQYFSSNSINKTKISTRVEQIIRHNFNSPVTTDLKSVELSAKWTGDFYFEPGDYVFSIKSDKGIKLQIDNEIVLNDSLNQKVTIYKINKKMEGVHRLVVEYNINNTLSTDSVNSTLPTEPVVEINSETPTIEVAWDKDNSANNPLLGGLHYTLEEVEIWKERIQNGPFRSKGDFAPNSPGDWGLILSNATAFLANPSEELWIPEGDVNSSIYIGDKNPYKIGYKLMDAAFVYLVTGNVKHKNAVLSIILAQTQEPMTDFTNNSRYVHEVWSDIGGFIWTEWLLCYLHAFDYIKHDISKADYDTISKWLYNAAEWFYVESYSMNARYFDNDYNKRENGIISQSWLNFTGPRNEHPYYGGPELAVMSNHWNNRKSNYARFCGIAGVFFNQRDWIDNSRQFYQNWLRFNIFPDGTSGEMNRALTSKNHEVGLAYAMSTLDQCIAFADVLARSGDNSLYEFTTSDGYVGHAGGEKNILLVIKAAGKYFGDLWSPKRYAVADNGNKNAAYLINGEMEGSWYGVHDTWVCQANLYYKDEEVKKMYLRVYDGFPKSPMSGNMSYRGNGFAFPGKLFMFGLNEGKVNPYK